MSDLRKALERFGYFGDVSRDDVSLFAAAARRLLEAEEQPPVYWCEEHWSSCTFGERCDTWRLWNSVDEPEEALETDCRFVSKLLIDPQEGESE